MAILQGTVKEDINSYYGFVLRLEDLGNGTTKISALDRPRVQMPMNATNELWMTFMRSHMDDSGNITEATRHYTVCRLYNVTYSINPAFENGVQTITVGIAYSMLEVGILACRVTLTRLR